ncbi:MAG TPA: SDR family oxidoreductase [Pseudolabrys sp.]|nr:SDR family oxidoreductase [Pseudolabrys sp.]
MYAELDGKVALVTGAGSNLGRATALALAKEGCRVGVVDLDLRTATATCETARAAGRAASPFFADMGNSEDVARMVDTVLGEMGRIDILVNCAGVPQYGRSFLADVDEKTFDQVMRVNVKGVWLAMKHVLPHMVAKGSGCVVSVASVMGLVAEPGLSIYATSKHGVLALTKAAALEYGPKGVRVNAVCPSRQENTMINPSRIIPDREKKLAGDKYMNPASGRAGRAEELAATVMFLCSDGASNIHGAAIAVDGGFTAQ